MSSTNKNLDTFGPLIDDGDSGDRKATFLISEGDDNWREIRIEIDTDDCDREHALAFKKALLELWNNQGE